jgi:hypothetical protein
MARPLVPDVGDDLQIWREAEVKLNKQSWTAENVLSSSFRDGREANTTHCKKKKKKKLVTKYHAGPRIST